MNKETNISDQMESAISKCHRTIQWKGEVQKIVCDKHVFAWSGKIPCIGTRYCIYCGQYEDAIVTDGSKQ